MDNHQNVATNAIGFCLLPSELIQNILLHLALPEIIAMKVVNKSIASVFSDQHFVRQCNFRSKSATWLFLYKKRWNCDAMLEGFSDQSTRWFKISIAELLKPLVSPRQNLYFLTANGNIFLFICNTYQQVVAVNLVKRTVRRIPDSPLGPRGTSSWRRSGMKLVTRFASDQFRFLFADLVDNRPVLFEYSSETDTWKSSEAKEILDNLQIPHVDKREDDYIFVNATNEPNESVVVAVESENSTAPVIVRPRFNGGGSSMERLHVYGDGHMMIVRSKGVENGRELKGIELWGLNLRENGKDWEYISTVPSEIIRKINKPYGFLIGCLEKADGVIQMVLLFSYECLRRLIWLSYDVNKKKWSWCPVPDCKMKGFNMAGIGLAHGLTLS
ncbi:uncharacterized protein LOC123200366 [Mangifera indica]|uniref:uncharacterized protein LOC123200366 n=1 Tax=Mangifera indica TaxID=29780 RepID=UPI001CFBF05B|nr:uncharacterized protein LOC123200366 [Mangifera indica]